MAKQNGSEVLAKVELTLTRPARKSGGDRYEGELEESQITFYVPQSLSRVEGEPRKTLTLSIQ